MTVTKEKEGADFNEELTSDEEGSSPRRRRVEWDEDKRGELMRKACNALLRFLQFLAVRRERGRPWVRSRETRSCEGRIDYSGAAVQL